MENLEHILTEAQQQIFKNFANSMSLTKEEQRLCYKSMIKTLTKSEVHKADIHNSWIEGWVQGWIEGWHKGRKEAAIEIATRLLSLNYTIDLISQSTSLSVDEIEKLQS